MTEQRGTAIENRSKWSIGKLNFRSHRSEREKQSTPNGGPLFSNFSVRSPVGATRSIRNFRKFRLNGSRSKIPPFIQINVCYFTRNKKNCLELSMIFLPWLLLETTRPEFRNQFYRFLTCSTDGIKKTVIVIGANKSAREHDSMEGHVILCHELMKSDLKHTIP